LKALRRVGRVVMQRIANPCTPVRFRYPPPIKSITYMINYPKNEQKISYTIHTQSGDSSSLDFHSTFSSIIKIR
jgi:hypothetical protein